MHILVIAIAEESQEIRGASLQKMSDLEDELEEAKDKLQEMQGLRETIRDLQDKSKLAEVRAGDAMDAGVRAERDKEKAMQELSNVSI